MASQQKLRYIHLEYIFTEVNFIVWVFSSITDMANHKVSFELEFMIKIESYAENTLYCDGT